MTGFILPVLGFIFAQPKPTASPPGGTPSPLFYMKGVDSYATAREVDDELVVLAGSQTRKEGTPNWKKYKALRDQLVSEGALIPHEEHDRQYVFAEDVAFKSPTAAATVVNAGVKNGRITWKVKDTDQTYAEWQESKLAGIDADGAADE